MTLHVKRSDIPVKQGVFIEKLRTIIPELPPILKKLELSVGDHIGVVVKCEFYVSEEIEDANQSDSSN